jgi:hypothetical protein
MGKLKAEFDERLQNEKKAMRHKWLNPQGVWTFPIRPVMPHHLNLIT